MPKEATHPHKRLLQLDDELKLRIDDFRYRERFPTEAAAIRELIARGLKASEPKARGIGDKGSASSAPDKTMNRTNATSGAPFLSSSKAKGRKP